MRLKKQLVHFERLASFGNVLQSMVGLSFSGESLIQGSLSLKLTLTMKAGSKGRA